MSNPNKYRLRRTMMFLNCQKPSLIKDPYVYKPDSIMLDLEDAVAEREKDAARYSLYHALQEIDYRGVERVVRINGLDTNLWREDIRCAVAGGCDSIRIPKTETADDAVHHVVAVFVPVPAFDIRSVRYDVQQILQYVLGQETRTHRVYGGLRIPFVHLTGTQGGCIVSVLVRIDTGADDGTDVLGRVGTAITEDCIDRGLVRHGCQDT